MSNDAPLKKNSYVPWLNGILGSPDASWIRQRIAGVCLMVFGILMSIRVNGEFLTAAGESDLANRASGGAFLAGLFIVVLGRQFSKKTGREPIWWLVGLVVAFVLGVAISLYSNSIAGGSNPKSETLDRPGQCAKVNNITRQTKARMGKITANVKTLGLATALKQSAAVFDKAAADFAAISPSITDKGLRPIVDQILVNVRAIAQSYHKRAKQDPAGAAEGREETKKLYEETQRLSNQHAQLCGRE